MLIANSLYRIIFGVRTNIILWLISRDNLYIETFTNFRYIYLQLTSLLEQNATFFYMFERLSDLFVPFLTRSDFILEHLLY